MSKYSLISTLWVVLLAGAEPSGVVAAEKPDRLQQEAIALFQSIVQHEPGQMDSCALADSWDNYSIPEEFARRHLGMKLHANLVSPDTGTKPAEIIDPQGVNRQAFCSEDEAKRQKNTKLEDFRTGALKIEKGPYDLSPTLTSALRKYTFPVFDPSYRRAVIVTSYTSIIPG
jgi:hypothetical protein